MEGLDMFTGELALTEEELAGIQDLADAVIKDVGSDGAANKIKVVCTFSRP